MPGSPQPTSTVPSDGDLRAFWERADVMLAIIDDAGRFAAVNPAWTTALGWSADDLIGRCSRELLHPDDAAVARAHADESRRVGAPQVTDLQSRCRHRDGSYRWLDWTSHRRGSRWFSVARDVTAMRLSHDALHHSERRFRALLDALDEGFVIISADGRVLEVNARFSEMTGWSSREAVGLRAPFPWWPPEERARAAAVLTDDLAGDRAGHEMTFQHRDGSRFPVLVDTAPLTEGPGEPAIAAIVRDITDLVRTRDELRDARGASDAPRAATPR